MLQERADRARWLAIAWGFAGVLLVVQPAADGFKVYAVLARRADLRASRPADAQDVVGHAGDPGHARHRRRGLADGSGGDGLSGLDADARARTGRALVVIAAMRHTR